MKREPSAMLAWMLLAVASVAAAAVVVTESPGKHELRDANSHPINKYDTHEQCVAAAAITPGRYRCVSTTIIDVVGSCEGVPQPAPIVDAEGFTDLGNLEGHQCQDGVRYSFTQTQPVPAPYPACWEVKPVPITACTDLIEDWWTP